MYKKGLLYAFLAYLTWGLFPIYWKLLHQVDAVQLIGHRITWSFIILMIIIFVTRQFRDFKKAAINRQVITIYFFAAIMIAINWLVYVYGVNANYIIETSLGYFINPLLSVLLGVFFLHEKLRPFQWVSVAIAAIGVIFLTFVYGQIPWIALSLAVSFATYGLLKKLAPLGSLYGLTIETGLLFIPALIYLIYLDMTGSGAFMRQTPVTTYLLMGAGVVTTIPLLLFASATKNIPLSMVGIMQYLTPSMQLILGIYIYGEKFDQSHFIGFAIVWLALIVFVIEGFWMRKTVSTQPIPELGEG